MYITEETNTVTIISDRELSIKISIDDSPAWVYVINEEQMFEVTWKPDILSVEWPSFPPQLANEAFFGLFDAEGP